MPTIDMPVEQLRKYNGVNPKPHDFDEYWDKAIEEMKNTNPEISLTKADFQCPGTECYDMYFTGVNGARIYAKHLRPQNISGKIPAIVLFHGYSGHSGEWFFNLPFVQAGFAVFSMDTRGQSGKSEDVGGVHGTTYNGHIIRGLDDEDPNKLLFRDIFLDTAELAGIVMDLDYIDENKVYTYGGSQGGALSLACAALEPRIAKTCAHYPFLSDYKRVWEMDLAENAYGEIRQYLRNYDPEHKREDQIFTKLGYIDIQNLAPRIKATVYMITGLMDKICPPSTQYAVYNKISSKKRHTVYPDYGHEDIRTAHDLSFAFFLED
ncbi:MAG: alpha/beta fold hydrolase [Clostridia bacterium]|nr:alpha/beta fold hydrolase [Clostridia bacterium]